MHPYQAEVTARQLRERRHKEAEAWRRAHQTAPRIEDEEEPEEAPRAAMQGGPLRAARAALHLVWARRA